MVTQGLRKSRATSPVNVRRDLPFRFSRERELYLMGSGDWGLSGRVVDRGTPSSGDWGLSNRAMQNGTTTTWSDWRVCLAR